MQPMLMSMPMPILMWITTVFQIETSNQRRRIRWFPIELKKTISWWVMTLRFERVTSCESHHCQSDTMSISLSDQYYDQKTDLKRHQRKGPAWNNFSCEFTHLQRCSWAVESIGISNTYWNVFLRRYFHQLSFWNWFTPSPIDFFGIWVEKCSILMHI